MAGATCRINGERGGKLPFGYSLPLPPRGVPRRRHSAPAASALLSPARAPLSPVQPGRSCRSDFSQHSRTGARAASHARDSHLSKVRPRSPQSVTGAVRLRGGDATAVRVGPGEERSDRECSGEKKKFFLEKFGPTASSTRAPHFFVRGYLVYRNYFSLLCSFSFHSQKRHRIESTSFPCSVPLFYTRWWWSGGRDIALFPRISTPRGTQLWSTLSFFFC